MARIQVDTSGKDTGQRSFRELESREAFMFADRLYIKAEKDEDFYGDVFTKANGEHGDHRTREMNCFCLTTGTFGSFRFDTCVEPVELQTIKIKTRRKS